MTPEEFVGRLDELEMSVMTFERGCGMGWGRSGSDARSVTYRWIEGSCSVPYWVESLLDMLDCVPEARAWFVARANKTRVYGHEPRRRVSARDRYLEDVLRGQLGGKE